MIHKHFIIFIISQTNNILATKDRQQSIHLHKSLFCFQCVCWQLAEQYLTDLHLLHCLNSLLPGTSLLPEKLQWWDLATSVATLCPSSVAYGGFPYSCSLYKCDSLSHTEDSSHILQPFLLVYRNYIPFNRTSLSRPCLVIIKLIYLADQT